MNKRINLLLFVCAGLGIVTAGCATRRYNTMAECEEQMEMFPCVPPVANEAKTAITPLGAEALIGKWHGEYIWYSDTYDGRMVQPAAVKYAVRYIEDYEFLANGTFLVTIEIRSLMSEYFNPADKKRGGKYF